MHSALQWNTKKLTGNQKLYKGQPKPVLVISLATCKLLSGPAEGNVACSCYVIIASPFQSQFVTIYACLGSLTARSWLACGSGRSPESEMKTYIIQYGWQICRVGHSMYGQQTCCRPLMTLSWARPWISQNDWPASDPEHTRALTGYHLTRTDALAMYLVMCICRQDSDRAMTV